MEIGVCSMVISSEDKWYRLHISVNLALFTMLVYSSTLAIHSKAFLRLSNHGQLVNSIFSSVMCSHKIKTIQCLLNNFLCV